MASIDISAFTGVSVDLPGSGTPPIYATWAGEFVGSSDFTYPGGTSANGAGGDISGYPDVSGIPDGATIISADVVLSAFGSGLNSHSSTYVYPVGIGSGRPGYGTTNGAGWSITDQVVASHLDISSKSALGAALLLMHFQFSGGELPSGTGGHIEVTSYVLHVEYSLGTPTSVEPAIGGTLGGDPVTIIGTGFSGSPSVTFGGDAATDVVVVDAEHITCVTPAHAAGLVDVVVDPGDTLVDGFTYTTDASTCVVNAGQAQTALGPLPSTVTLTGSVTRGKNNGTITYAWTQPSGPATPTISSPTTPITDIVFAAYVPGVYIFQLAATTESLGGISFTATDTVSVVINPTIAPRVSTGNAQLTWPADTATLTPVVRDDGWGGALSYAWALLSGPDTPTIVSPTALSTDITVPQTSGVYVFTLTVSRADDALEGVGWWRVTLYTATMDPDGSNLGLITITANGSPKPQALIASIRVTENGSMQDTCGFTMFGAHIDVGNDVILERGAVRMFGGVCLSLGIQVNKTFQLFYEPGLIGYAWHLTRKRVTKTYTNTSATDIVLDLLAMAPTAIGSDYVAAGLPGCNIAFDDVSLDVALTALAKQLNPPAHWRVDYYKKAHFAIIEADGDPLALSPQHPTMRNLSFVKDLSQTVNRVTIHYDLVTSKPVLVAAEIPVSSLDGYDPAGGVTTINWNTIFYTGTRQGLVDSVYGTIGVLVISQTPAEGGEFATGTLVGYILTAVTSLGETPVIASWSAVEVDTPNTACDLVLTAFDAAAAVRARVSRLNIYRTSNEGAAVTFLVGSFVPIAGARFLDGIALANIPTPLIEPPITNTADALGFWLTGCSGYQDTHTPSQVTVQDTDAQAALAAALGGTDDGVIEISLQGGSITTAAALEIATSFLDRSSAVRLSVACDVRDDKAHPGQTLSVNFPAPLSISGDLVIQQAQLVDLQPNVPHAYSVRAAPDIVTIEDLLKGAMA